MRQFSHNHVSDGQEMFQFLSQTRYPAAMTVTATPAEMRARALTDLRMGLPVVLDGAHPMLVFAVETLTPARFAAAVADPSACLVVTDWRAQTLKTPVYDGDITRLALPKDADLTWARAMADPTLDLRHPLKGPFQPIRDGDAAPARAGIVLAKSAHLLPAVIVTRGTLADPSLTRVSLPDAVPAGMDDVASAALPMEASEAGRLSIFRPTAGGEEHYAIEIGDPDRSKPVLVRLHSACFTGDVLGSLKCDCGPQLRGALAQMGAEGSGILLYLNQEGRGIGLANKMRAYALQAQGFDTVEANHRLGFQDDERNFELGSDILRKLGVGRVRLMTNNPAKIERLSKAGIDVVERIPLHIAPSVHNAGYLDTKSKKSGHLL